MALGIQPSRNVTASSGTDPFRDRPKPQPKQGIGIIVSRCFDMQAQRPRSIVERLSMLRLENALHLLAIIRSLTPPINDSCCLEERIDRAGPLMAVRYYACSCTLFNVSQRKYWTGERSTLNDQSCAMELLRPVKVSASMSRSSIYGYLQVRSSICLTTARGRLP